ncbi:MAG: phage shock protein A [Spirochaetales bacterium]|jgi:phage shock protein A|nr:phage shock protein A [Spirochaetales bacterium]HPB42061.1 PspA/IM30 family protein [Sphaerochaeta sp.]HPY44899.1 PspA/IM30 family protein [Sphaerochaeta sp.]HQB04353.1 PspA/IM30 family protein [Sphaerochaeta sp.]
MGVFSRFLDIVNANINALLDKAEDPEKMIRLMIQEMEDTLIELKSSAAAKMATLAKSKREYNEFEEEMKRWQARAELAISKGREDLAREALLAKRQVSERLEPLLSQIASSEELISVAKSEIDQIEQKLASVKQKYQTMVDRANRAKEEEVVNTTMRRSTDDRFAEMQDQIDRMQASNELNRRNASLDEQFRKLEEMEELEAELAELRKLAGGKE